MATIKYWNGSAWELAIVGKQGPAGATGPTGPAGSATLQRFRFVATGGETSLSGTDANGNTLAYTSGLEEVFLNGAALVRGQDYIATNGTSITSLAALTATDVVEILAWGVFDVANTISTTLIDAKGDILAGSAADTVSRLAVGANNTVLTADSTTATGLKWATASSGGMTLLSTTTLSGATTTISSISQSYKNLYVEVISQTNATGNGKFNLAPNGDTSYCDTVGQYMTNGSTATAYAIAADVIRTPTDMNYNFQNTRNRFTITFFDYTSASDTRAYQGVFNYYAATNTANTQSVTGQYMNTTAITSLVFSNTGGNQTGGTVKIYGVN